MEQARDIRDTLPDVWNQIYIPTDESEEALDSVTPWHFGKSQLYMHHFSNMQNYVSELDELAPLEIHSMLRTKLRSAQSFYDQISDALIDLERHGNGDHVPAWLSAINRYAREFLRNQ